MTTQNITLALPKTVLRRVKLLAAKRQVSVSALLTQALEDLVTQDEGYARAKARHLAHLRQAPDLGTDGDVRWGRESLHER